MTTLQEVSDINPSEQSFAHLAPALAELRPKLMRQARLLVGNPSVAEDLVQETLLTVLGRHAQHTGAASLGTWAIAILKNKISDWYRSPEYRRMKVLVINPDSDPDPLDELFNEHGEHVAPLQAWERPEREAEQHQLRKVLNVCVERLPGPQGTAFMMREWLGFETAEVADRLQISPDNCRMLLHRARLSLRGCLQIRWFGKTSA
ncbi:MAG: sigma-70 family RNA polymerase sigma factor [Prosthecobacter sp.]|nr:sigma-70 family RNA polymerase sigma factor [Prosthecobacter sp.]